MEHERYMEINDVNERNATLDAMQHNLGVAGENNYAVRINKLDLKTGILLQRAYDEQMWRVVKKFPNGQVLMKHEYEAENHRPHGEIWGAHRLVRVPQGVI